MNMKRLIIRGAVVEVLAGAALLPAVGSAQATPLSCDTIEARYSTLLGLSAINNNFGRTGANTYLATANYYFGLGDMYWDMARNYLRMGNVQAC